MNNANGGNILFHFKGDSSQLQKTTNSLGSMTKSILVATGITKALSTAWNLVSSSTDDAIDRFDQLNAFPKVMKSLGVSTEASEKAVQQLSERLKGLPTTLDKGTSAVSRFVAKNGDVEKSTEMFLAVNNAILAGNAPMEQQTTALEQITQAYSKGKPDMMEWRTLMTAMPGQLKQVAKAMGYVSTDALHDALVDGTASMDDMMNAIMRLNTEGVDGLDSFEVAARNATGGIKTAMTNLKTAVVRGVSNVVDSIDKGLKQGGVQGGINELINKIGSGFEEGLTKIGKLFGENLGKLLSGEISTEEFSNNIASFLLEGLEKGINWLTEQAPVIIPKVIDFILGVVNALSDSLPTLIPAIVELVSQLVDILTRDEIMEKIGEAGAKLGKGLWEGLSKSFENESGKGGLVEKLATRPIESLANTFISYGVPVFTKTGRSLLVGLFLGIAEQMGIDKETKKALEEHLKGFINKPLEFLYDVGKKIIEGLYNGILECLGLKKPGKDIKKDVKKNVGDDANTWLYNVGKDIVQGLINGIMFCYSPLLSVANKIAGVVGNIIANKNKIHSPSRLMEWYGEMMGEGYILGIENMKNAIMDTAIDTFSISPQLANSSSLNYSPNVIVNNNIINETDPLGQTVSQIKTFANGAKQDYNYGMGV